MAIQLSGSLDLTGSLQISGSINDIYFVDFDLKDSAAAVGRLGWDDGEGTLTIGLSGGNLNIPIGVTNFETAFNADSSSISKGDVVRVSGAQGNRVSVKKANNWGDEGSATTVALAAETIGVGAEGKVIISGPLKGVNTTAFGEGDLLYVSSTPGGITNIKPQAPLHEVRVGVAQRIHASVGIINVKVDNGYEIDELHNVRITTASLAFNQLLAYSGSVWRNETIDGLGIATTASLNPVLAYTASLKGAAIVSSSAQIQNYFLFAQTSSANLFYGNQSISGSKFELHTSDANGGIVVNSKATTSQTFMTFLDRGTNDNFTVGTFVDVNGTNQLGGLAIVGHRKDNQSGLVLRGQNKVANSGAVNGYITAVIGNAYSDNALTTLTTGVTGKSISFLGQDTELANLNFNGDLTITNGNLVVASGKGIDFSATSNGSGTTSSELLNDYEEGTWTPGLSAGTSGTITVNTGNSKASYTKIGRAVTLQCFIEVSSVSSPVGRLSVTGFPFTVGSNLGDATAAVYNTGFTGNPGGWPILRVQPGTTAFIDIQESDGTNPAIDLSDHITTGTELIFSVTYFV